MTDFTLREIHTLRVMLMPPATLMRQITYAFSEHHSRAEVVEAIDALHREADDARAMTRVNDVLRLQECGIPLINSKAARDVLQHINAAYRESYWDNWNGFGSPRR